VTNLDVSIVITSRERFSHSERSLENLFDQTSVDVPIIYVSAGAPPHIQHYLEQQSNKRPFRLISVTKFMSPNQARNLGLEKVHTKYVVFLDNDTLLTPGWLEALVECAEDTNAAIVAPLYLIGELEDQIIHMAGGIIEITDSKNERIMIEEHRYADTHLTKLSKPLERKACDYIEFHCVLTQRKLFDEIGTLDEELLSVNEHIDISLAAKQVGGVILLEPKSVISYIAPPPCEWWDLPFYQLRWSDQWTRHSVAHFKQKWNFSSVLYRGDEPDDDAEDTIVGWGRGHRRLMAGLHISEKDIKDSDLNRFYQSALMLALFDTVDRGRFNVHLFAPTKSLRCYGDLEYAALIERLPKLLLEADDHAAEIKISIQPSHEAHQPALFCIRNMSASARDLVGSLAFLILHNADDSYDCWIAVARDTWQRLPRVRRLIRHKSAESVNPSLISLAGSWNPKLEQSSTTDLGQVSIFEARVGHLLTANQLEQSTGFALFESSVLVD